MNNSNCIPPSRQIKYKTETGNKSTVDTVNENLTKSVILNDELHYGHRRKDWKAVAIPKCINLFGISEIELYHNGRKGGIRNLVKAIELITALIDFTSELDGYSCNL